MAKEKKFYTLDERILREQKRLMKIFENLPEERKKLSQKLIERAAYMLISIENMEAEIKKNGLLVRMPQGKYEIEIAHPLINTHNATIKNYVSLTKQIFDLIPPTEAREKAGEEINKFINREPISK